MALSRNIMELRRKQHVLTLEGKAANCFPYSLFFLVLFLWLGEKKFQSFSQSFFLFMIFRYLFLYSNWQKQLFFLLIFLSACQPFQLNGIICLEYCCLFQICAHIKNFCYFPISFFFYLSFSYVCILFIFLICFLLLSGSPVLFNLVFQWWYARATPPLLEAYSWFPNNGERTIPCTSSYLIFLFVMI